MQLAQLALQGMFSALALAAGSAAVCAGEALQAGGHQRVARLEGLDDQWVHGHLLRVAGLECEAARVLSIPGRQKLEHLERSQLTGATGVTPASAGHETRTNPIGTGAQPTTPVSANDRMGNDMELRMGVDRTRDRSGKA